MPVIDTSNPNANWHDVLEIWSRLANWTHYKPTERQLTQQVRQFAIALWSEKDWLIAQYPTQRHAIEKFMTASEPLSIVADLANTAKHRFLTQRSRSSATETAFHGRVSVRSGASRRMYYIRLPDGRHIEIMTVLRSALDTLEEYRHLLSAGQP